MKTDLRPKPIDLNIDVEQWRREIQTFVESTMSELQAINDDLARGFAGSASGAPAERPLRSVDEMAKHSTLSTRQTTANGETTNSLNRPAGQSDDRLTRLKKQIEQRVSAAKP